MDTALSAGRKDVTQTFKYDQRSSEDFLEKIDELTGGELTSPLQEAASSLAITAEDETSLTKKEFLKLNIGAAHTTEYGYCFHDFAANPCEMHRDCINCQEHACVKGDASKAERLRSQLELIEKQLEDTEQAIKEGAYGSNQWYEKHKQTRDRLRKLVDAMDDETIPEGAIIQLSGVEQCNPTTAAISGGDSLMGKTFNQYLEKLIP